MNRPVSIKDLARLADVSHSTVSRALRNSPLVNIETAEKIQQLARERGYRASLVARSLVTRETKAIGCVASSIVDPFVAEVISGVEDTAHRLGYAVLLANSNTDPDREIQSVLSFQDRRVDGILVVGSRVGARYGAHLASLRLPIVLVNNQHTATHIHSVMIDNLAAGEAATNHLAGLGHKRIAYIGSTGGQLSDEERMQGYQSALSNAGIPIDPQLIVRDEGTPAGGERAMNRLRSVTRPPTAVFCYDDLMSIGACHAIRAHNLRIPADISIIGFDDLFVSQYLSPPLTTMRQPMRRMGGRAMELLAKLRKGVHSREYVRIQADLVVRSSTGPVPAGHKE
jgi:DNA-binding LacI/PurR family transcriptional regulator